MSTEENEKILKARRELEELDLDKIYEEAPKGKRVANAVIDYIVHFIITLMIGLIIGIVSPSLLDTIDGNRLIDIAISYVITFLYFLLFEMYTGKTIGKIMTKTMVLTSDFKKPKPSTILYRSLYRLVPFDAFSFIGSDSEGWHDQWSETIVVNQK